MTTLAGIVFSLALAGIIGLFALKRRELSTGRTLAPALRERADSEALRLKELIGRSGKEIEKVPPFVLLLTRRLIHIGAIEFARLAHRAGRGAHDLADFVSHKHNFERRETRSEFLRRVGEVRAKPEPGLEEKEEGGHNG